MPRFGRSSKQKLDTLHPDLQRVLNRVIEWYDFTILEGHRGKEAQNKAFETGRSKIKWPDGKHNTSPSEAVDIAPWPVDWASRRDLTPGERQKIIGRFYVLAGAVLQAGYQMGIKLRWGGDWDGDLDMTDQKFDDLPHFELVRRG